MTENKKFYLSNEDIIKLVKQDKWDKIYSKLIKGEISRPNKLLINGNNILHMACIRGRTNFIERVFDLCYSKARKVDNLDQPLNIFAKIECGIDPDIPNEDGIPPIHLYYKYGGTSRKLLKFSSVCILDKDYMGLFVYLIDKIDLLEVYIDSTLEKNCLTDIEYIRKEINAKHNIYYLLIKQIKKIDDQKIKNRYLQIISQLIHNITNKKAVFYAIAMDSHEVFDHLIKDNLFDPMIRNSNQETPLIMAVINQNDSFVRKILEAYKQLETNPIKLDLPNIKEYISLYRTYSDGRPINICIMNKTYDMLDSIIDFLIDYREREDDRSYHTETDEYNSTYLHNYLLNEDDKVLEKILLYLIKYTDLNQENYYGYTPAHLIFLKGFWKNNVVKKSLKNRMVDLLKIDPNGLNIYSYIAKEDKKEFMNLTSNLILLPNTKGSSKIDSEIYDVERIIDVMSREELKQKKDYGLFNPTQLNYIMFILYLLKSHSNLFIPVRPYDSNKKKSDQYLMEMTSYSISSIQETFNDIQLSDHTRFYSYVPHLISWYDSKFYIIHPELSTILKKQNEYDPNMKRRFVLLKLMIVLSENSNHANCLVYDRKKREAWRFESYGLTDLVKDGEIMDMTLRNFLETVYGKIKYNSPSMYLSNIKFQLVDNEDFTIAKNLGDPGGYCLAWCIWFVDIICSNLHGESDEPTVDYLIRNYITRDRFKDIFLDKKNDKAKKKTITMPIGELNISQNIYLEYIRQYGHYLDQVKNKIFNEIGTSKEAQYRFLVKSSDMNKINKYLQIKEVKYN